MSSFGALFLSFLRYGAHGGVESLMGTIFGPDEVFETINVIINNN